jgi:hypothetical protein
MSISHILSISTDPGCGFELLTVVIVLNGAALALYWMVMMRYVEERRMTPSLT